jgi:hypothetical protein
MHPISVFDWIVVENEEAGCWSGMYCNLVMGTQFEPSAAARDRHAGTQIVNKPERAHRYLL